MSLGGGSWIPACAGMTKSVILKTLMDPVFILIFIVIIGFLVIGFLVLKQSSNNEMMQIMRMLHTGSKEDRKILLESLSTNTSSLNQRLDRVQKNLGEMSEIGRSMRDLQEFLQSPKLRGNIGEQVLNELLKQMLPDNSFHLQYSFKSGEKVDAAIKTSAGIVPIDSKFPMENFRKMMSSESESDSKGYKKLFTRDVKRHTDAISKKYILTDEGTIDYALMYIPSEAVYYEVVNSPDLFEYAGDKRVLPVSPTTFYAYMKAILMSFEGQKVEQKAQEILKLIKAISRDYEKVEDNLSTLQKHINNANNMMGNVLDEFGKLGQKLSKTDRLDIDS